MRGASGAGGEEEGDGEFAVAIEGEFAEFVAMRCVAEEAEHEDGFAVGARGVPPVDQVDEVVDEVGAEGVAVAERLEDDVADLVGCEVRDGDGHARSVATRSLFGESRWTRLGGGEWAG